MRLNRHRGKSSRLVGRAFWGWATAVGLLLILWTGSLRWRLIYEGTQLLVVIKEGEVRYMYTTSPYRARPSGWTIDSLRGRLVLTWPWWQSEDEYRYMGSVPLWIPILALSALSFVPLLLGRKRRSLHACAECCYNLTGNTSGICPECGTPIPDEAKEKLPTDPPKQ